MPEGDTIFRTAATLRGVIEGATIRHAGGRSETIDLASLAECTLANIEARGKHLLMHLDDGRAIHSHMGMTGSWHTYAPHEAWQKPAHWAEITLIFEGVTAVCFTPKLLELLTPDGLRRHPWLTRLGPDILATSFDQATALARMRVHNATAIGEAVMNQTIVCGIGNVYKSELLFVTGVHPRTKVGELDDGELVELIERARKLMRRNLSGFRRITRFRGDSQKQWVYGRAGEPCLTCGTAIEITRQGDLGRVTFWCPHCQKPRKK
jgi:endonuclease-8